MKGALICWPTPQAFFANPEGNSDCDFFILKINFPISGQSPVEPSSELSRSAASGQGSRKRTAGNLALLGVRSPTYTYEQGFAAALVKQASTVLPEDDMTTGMEDNIGNLGIEDDVVTTGASEEPHETGGLTTLVPASTESKPDIHIEDLPTAESTVRDKEDSQRRTTTPHMVASHPPEKADGDTQITVEKDGLATVTLIGIIVGVLLAIGIIGGIIVVAVRKMSGRP
ncbi:podoplanin isoform X2 [Manis pentadactyla]|uniref:podoplanin isoform X2 n=1 Tax=Manis pentadactyla TaxID=143292 RepID=UPI00255C9B20|nr:podoplanin isoform X2 [Manis pentadactyla]